MLAKRIIPCLDVDRGRVVKGREFAALRDAGDAVEQARRYDSGGADELVLLDISASWEERETALDLVRQVADSIFIPFTVGGGVRTIDDIHRLLLAGADKVGINTAAVENPRLVSEAARKFGAQCVVVAIDARAANASRADERRWRVFTHGGRRERDLGAVEWALELERRGAGEILLTSMDRDGTKDGYDIDLTRAVASEVKIPVIASGGAGKLEHLRDVLTNGKASAALAASIFHYGQHSISEVKRFLAAAGVRVRTSAAGISND